MQKNNRKTLEKSYILALAALLAALLAVGTATFAWYIYNTSNKTTDIHMAAGTSTSIQISTDRYDNYGTAVDLHVSNKEYTLQPVSSTRISDYFVKAKSSSLAAFGEGQKQPVVDEFTEATDSDYLHRQVYLRTNGNKTDVYVAGISYKEEEDTDSPLSTAIRVGLVSGSGDGEYIFEINKDRNPKSSGYNTYNFEEEEATHSPYAIARKSSGTGWEAVEFGDRLLDSSNWCYYDQAAQTASLEKTDSATDAKSPKAICTISGDGKGGYGDPVMVDIYVWLEGCDPDCTMNLCGKKLENLAITFAGVEEGGES